MAGGNNEISFLYMKNFISQAKPQMLKPSVIKFQGFKLDKTKTTLKINISKELFVIWIGQKLYPKIEEKMHIKLHFLTFLACFYFFILFELLLF